jgi:sulfonate transport system permease protein
MEIEQRRPAAVTAPAAIGRRLPEIGWRGLVLPALLLVAWQLVSWAGVFEPSQLPSPADVLSAARELIASGQLVAHIAASGVRVLAGFALGSLLALAIGLAVGLWRAAEEFTATTIQAVRAIPSLAWVPLLILWMGIDEAPKITLVAIGTFFPVFTNLASGIRQTDYRLVEAARAYGLHGLALAREVLLPSALPALLTGLRIGLAQAWLFLVAAELIAASRGLGFMLIDSQNTGRADVIVLTIAILALLGKLTDWLLERLERRLLRWQPPFRAER